MVLILEYVLYFSTPFPTFAYFKSTFKEKQQFPFKNVMARYHVVLPPPSTVS